MNLKIGDLVRLIHKDFNKWETFQVLIVKSKSAKVININNQFEKYWINNLNIIKKL
jgi:hypothetical protein|tara:strand:- start:3017 stop:3184 length:168 start_codon:yes stop_codon:yes gene_type:complete